MRSNLVTVLLVGFSMLTGCGGASNGAFAPNIPATKVRPLSDVFYSFGPYPDAQYPLAGLLAGKNGEYYGTSQSGGNPSHGTVYEIAATGKEQVLYAFQDMPDGADPTSSLMMDKEGVLYGTTETGGDSGCNGPGCGTVFKLTPGKQGWTESVLYRFQGSSDGGTPIGGVMMTKSGALLGPTYSGGSGWGVIYELTPSGSSYSEKIVHEFSRPRDGLNPIEALVSDSSGNLYGTTDSGGLSCACGTVFKLTPSGSTYSFSVIYRFKGGADGMYPWASLLRGSNGMFYGLTIQGGTRNKGTVFELAPMGSRYREKVLYSFKGGTDGAYPGDTPGLVADDNGNLYGTTSGGGGTRCECGTVFSLTRSGKGFTEHVLYAFQGGKYDDGRDPSSGVIIDRKGNLLGTTFRGGDSRSGTIFSVCCAATSKK